MMIGEIYLPIHQLVSYYGQDNNGAQLPFNFLLIALSWDALKIAAAIDEYEGALPPQAWPNWVLGNHDQPRITSRVGLQQARVAAMLLLTLRGTPTIYYGDELGMKDVPIPANEVQDPQGLRMPGKNLSRDPERTPMQWEATAHAGFSKARPWLRIGPGYKRENVQAQKDDPYSMLCLYKRLIQLRQSEPALMYGAYKPLYSDHQAIAFTRQAGEGDAFLMVFNFSHRPCYIQLKHGQVKGKIVLASSPDLEGADVTDTINLGGDEGIIVRLTYNTL
jgi:alpha-glucosidase